MKPVESKLSDASSIHRTRLNIAVVSETYPPEINGVAMTLKRMVDGLVLRGHRVQLVRPRQSVSEQPSRGPAFEEYLAKSWKLPRYEGLRFGLPAQSTLTRLWSRSLPDLVHVATEGPLGWSAVSAAQQLGIPVTSDFHTNFDHYSHHYGLGWLKQAVTAYLRKFHNRTGSTFVPTEEMAVKLRQQGYRRVDVIARGVDTALFNRAQRSRALRQAWGLGDDDLVVCHVGRLAPEKNLPLLMRSFAAIRALDTRARLVLVGDGPLREALMREHPEVIFAGMRTGVELAAHYASADLFLFPSMSETFGNVTLEAMASGLSVVAYDYAAARALIRNGANGITVPFGDEDSFVAEALHVAGSRALRRTLRESACMTAMDCSWEEINRQFEHALLTAYRKGLSHFEGRTGHPTTDERHTHSIRENAARGVVSRGE